MAFTIKIKCYRSFFKTESPHPFLKCIIVKHFVIKNKCTKNVSMCLLAAIHAFTTISAPQISFKIHQFTRFSDLF